MATCETSESTSSPVVGIILTLLACCCYSFGNCLQRYALLRQPGEKVWVLNRHAGWLAGAIIYFSANGLYAIALSFAPVSVLAAVFSLTIITNAVCAVYLLGDKIPKWAYPGYVMVILGSIVFSVTLNSEVCHFDGSELVEVMTTASALVFWTALLLVILFGMVFAWRFEKAHPLKQEVPEDLAENVDADAYNYVDADRARISEEGMSSELKKASDDDIDPRSLLIARFIYPTSLGATEAVGALVLKAVNSLFTTIATDEDEANNVDDDASSEVGLWIALSVSAVFLFLGIIMWLRLVYSRFEITGAFPVEFGMLTFGSVIGGFAVFQDYKFVDSAMEWVGVAVAGTSILGGIGVVAWASWRAQIAEPLENHSVNDSNEE